MRQKGMEGQCSLKDVGFGGVGNDVWWRVLRDCFVLARELLLLADALQRRGWRYTYPFVSCSTCHVEQRAKAETIRGCQ
jgi:hypothetical protein